MGAEVNIDAVYGSGLSAWSHKPRIAGSNPASATNWGCSSAGRAAALQAVGQEFDPPHFHQD